MGTNIQFRKCCSLVCCFKDVKIKIFKTIILPLLLYGCGTWYLKLREKHRLRGSENRVLRRIFGLTRNGIIRV
jgi:hypothetical protein